MSHRAMVEKLGNREIHLGVVSQPGKRKKLDFAPLFTDELFLRSRRVIPGRREARSHPLSYERQTGSMAPQILSQTLCCRGV
jgi:hypothetical protein